jgi:hypothetical protein
MIKEVEIYREQKGEETVRTIMTYQSEDPETGYFEMAIYRLSKEYWHNGKVVFATSIMSDTLDYLWN